MAEEGVEERGNWTGKLDFILSAIGFAVGLGNVWRFPYLAYKNGGASFLFPYIIMLFISGLPLFFLELAIGQFTSEGPITCWKMAPVFMGIGYGMVTISAVISIYYNMIIAWAVYYMFVSFVSLDEELPWQKCSEEWNTPMCRFVPLPRITDDMTPTDFVQAYDTDCINDKINAATYGDVLNGTSLQFEKFRTGFEETFKSLLENRTFTQVHSYEGFKSCRVGYTTPAEEYFERFVLNQGENESLNDIGDISLKLIFTLLLSWALIFGCLMKGIKTSGKVVYFTATFPYVILVVLLVRGVTLEGHMEGIEFYVIPEWDKLTDITIWNQAATQIFYSLGVSFGGLLTMASYNKFDNNIYRDAVLVSVINCCTSIFAGFAIFSLLGHMAFITNKEVKDVATSGAGLAFVAYPDGISRLPSAPVWAFLFFFMILTLGMDSMFAMMETVISAISDIFPRVLRKHKTPFTLLVCIIGFLLGVPLCTEGGGRILTLMNDYSGSYNLMVIALFELLCLCGVYGVKQFRLDIEMMIGKRSNCFWVYWFVMWCALTPAALIFIIIMSATQYEVSTYEGKPLEGWAEGLGWVMVGVPILLVILVGLFQICKLGFKTSITPMARWGPVMPENHVGRYAHLSTLTDSEMDNVNGNGKSIPHGEGYDNLAVISERL